MTRPSLVLVVAAACCVGAALLFGSALVGALSVEPLPQAPAPVDEPVAEPVREARPLTTDALLLAVDSDPFRPDRQRAPDRYRLPGDELPEAPAEPPPPPPAPPFRLIGTALSPTGGLALIEIEGTTRVVDIGESLLGYTLAAVDTERATMVGPARTVHLPLVAMETDAEDPRRGGRPAARQGGGPGNQNQNQNAARAAQEAIRQMVERVRESGGNITPQMLQMIQRLQQEGRTVEIDAQPGRTMIRTRRDTTDAAPRASFQR